MNLGNNIKHLRTLKGYTQSELGDFVGLHQSQIANYEKEKSTPSFEILIKLSEILGVTLDELVTQDLIKHPPGERSAPPDLDQELIAVIKRLEKELSRMEARLERTEEVEEELKKIRNELIEKYPDAAKDLGFI